MGHTLTYLKAGPDDSSLLTQTAVSSKEYWGYPEEWMKLWQSELTVSKTYILRNHVVKVYCGQTFIGFYALISYGEGNWEVDHLWLTAENIRKGYGKEIFRHMIEHIRNAGGTRITLTAEPNAKGFYEKMGGKVIRRLESKIVGRFLEEYEFRTAT